MNVFAWLLLAWMVLGLVGISLLVGKPRPTLTPTSATKYASIQVVTILLLLGAVLV